MIDSHCHLADEAFAADREAVIARAREAGLARALCILSAADEREGGHAPTLARLWPGMRFAIGVHPHDAARFAGDAAAVGAAVRAALDSTPAAVAVGEVGLDYHYDFSPRDVQQQVFRTQVRLAREIGRPLVVHTREADADTVAILEEEGRGEVRGVFHCFSGTVELAREALRLGFFLSFSGIVTFPRADALRAVAAEVPADRLLLETDCPYLAPVPYRGKRNEPAWVMRVAECVAAVRAVSPGQISDVTDANFARLFETTQQSTVDSR